MVYIPDNTDTTRVFIEANDIASASFQTLSSVHVLLAFFTFSNRAKFLLNEKGIEENLLLTEVNMLKEESVHLVPQLRERARDIAKGARAEDVDCLHILIAILGFREALAYDVLKRSGVSLTKIRNIAMSYITGNMPRRYKMIPRDIKSKRVLEPVFLKSSRILKQPEIPFKKPVSNKVKIPEKTNIPKETLEKTTDFLSKPDIESDENIMDIQEIAPTLASCGIDLTLKAKEGKLDRVIGRDLELESLIDILGKRRSNNPILVGYPGVGKTAIVEGLAVKISNRDSDVVFFHNHILFLLDTGSLVAGTSLRGAFSERLSEIKLEVSQAKGRIIIFIDELHTLIGAGSSGEGTQDAANELKATLARGEFPCIGATTTDEFKKYIETDSALERRFTPIHINEPNVDESILIIEGSISSYSTYHNITYSLEAIHTAVKLSNRFIMERKLPDKAFAVLDLAGSRARRRNAEHVGYLDIARIIHEWSDVPLERLVEIDNNRFIHAEDVLSKKLIGHSSIVKTVCKSIKRGFAGFNGKRPMGSFLFLGPTGVGKTEFVKILAEFLFGRRESLVRIDMSEFAEKHSIARLIGAQPGYIGYEEGGQLTEPLRKRPFQVVLFDEIEKAHQDVLNLLLQVLDEGFLTDSRGNRVSFSHTLIILTSNLGADQFDKIKGRIGFGSDIKEDKSKFILDKIRSEISPELWGRLDEKLIFYPLNREQVCEIAEIQLLDTSNRLFEEHGITLKWNKNILDYLLNNGGFNYRTGARGMRQVIQKYVENPIADYILNKKISIGYTISISLDNNAIHFDFFNASQ